ncbi:MAG: VOC family protein [Chloroflexus sp.]|nr:VOC family protein [Chloroflexus sp.]
MSAIFRCQHICLTTDRLRETRDFYANILGLAPTYYDETVGVLAITLADGFVLRFETAGPPEPSGIRFIGLELDSFAAVDSLFEELVGRARIVEDLRARYTTIKGPYGFIIEDPNGYRLKLFKYGPRTQP